VNATGTERSLADRIVTAIRAVAGPGSVPLHEPKFAGNEWVYLKECLDSTFVSSVGAFVDRFEADLAAYTGARHAVAVVNGTAALQVALKLAGVRADDEVLIPALTFVATANAVAYCGAVPHLVDSDLRTLGMDAARLRDYLEGTTEQRGQHCLNRKTGRVIRALMPMHTFGHPVDLAGLLDVARDFNLALVEDAAESLGSFYDGRHTGTFGVLGALSFNGNKIVTTGGGGAILTDDAELARHAKHLTTTAKLPHAWEYRHDEIGFNYRMPNLNAALGCAQLERLPAKRDAKRALFERYRAAFAPVNGVSLFAEPANCDSNYWLQTLLLDNDQAHQRDAVLKATNDAGLMTRPAWVLMHELAPFKDCPCMELPVAQSLSQCLINIPSSVGMP
jgi:aminotransferase in exopolysaccharide biosynthesis